MSKQRVIPYLAYRDAPAAIEFLKRAFGFEERFRYPMEDGRIGHAEMTLGDSTLMLASAFEGFGASPLDLPATSVQLFYCVVDDVEAHHARAKAAGATLVAEPADQHGMRMYRGVRSRGTPLIFVQPLEET
ncbi:MAG: VOC family protein [Planctomycetota bacterium]